MAWVAGALLTSAGSLLAAAPIRVAVGASSGWTDSVAWGAAVGLGNGLGTTSVTEPADSRLQADDDITRSSRNPAPGQLKHRAGRSVFGKRIMPTIIGQNRRGMHGVRLPITRLQRVSLSSRRFQSRAREWVNTGVRPYRWCEGRVKGDGQHPAGRTGGGRHVGAFDPCL
jgi:hypothetical protein